MIPDGVKVLQVGELTLALKGVLEEGFASVWVAGEISNLKRAESGHYYLTLKDDRAQLRAKLWRGVAPRLRFEPKNGLAVVARGRIEVYAPYGEYSLIIEEMYPQGMGALELAFQQLKERLFGLGYFDRQRKKPLPRWPRRIALVTSPSGAAVRDMVEILARRWPAAEVVVAAVRVQGEGAADEIASALDRLNGLNASRRLSTDVIIVGRGGGSLEDLWAFNEEAVARAIFHSQIPVVSAVGHETDVTIADLVADYRALTPTHAAGDVVPDRAELVTRLHECLARLNDGVTRLLALSRQRLAELAGRRVFRLPLERVRDLERRLDDSTERLRRAGQVRLERAHERLTAASGRLAALSPVQVLARGFSLTLDAQGTVVRDATAVRTGDSVHVQLHRGRLQCRVAAVDGDAAI